MIRFDGRCDQYIAKFFLNEFVVFTKSDLFLQNFIWCIMRTGFLIQSFDSALR